MGAAGVRDRAPEDAHRLHDGDRAGAVVERAVRAVPGVVVGSKDDVLLGFGAAGDHGEGVEDRHLPEEAGLGVDAQHRPLVVLGQPVQKPVRLAAQVQDRCPLRAGAEDLVDAPALGPLRADDPRGSGRVQRFRQRARIEPRLPHAFAPLRDCALTLRCHAGRRLGPREPLQVVVRPATRLRARDEHELAAHLRQRCLEGSGAARVRQDHHLRFDGPVRGRAPGGRHALERAHARGHEIDVADAALPSAPGAVLLLVRLEAPFREFGQRPVVGAGHRGRAGEARPDRVHHHLAEFVNLRALDALLPDRPDDRVGGGEGLGGRLASTRQPGSHQDGENGQRAGGGDPSQRSAERRLSEGGEECQRAGDCDSNRGPHGLLRERELNRT